MPRRHSWPNIFDRHTLHTKIFTISFWHQELPVWFRKRPGKLRKGNSYQPLEFKDAKRNDSRKCCNQWCFPTATFPNDQNKQLETWWNRGDILYNMYIYIYISYICLWVSYLFFVGCRVGWLCGGGQASLSPKLTLFEVQEAALTRFFERHPEPWHPKKNLVKHGEPCPIPSM